VCRNAIYATVHLRVLSESHRVFKLGGQVSFAQQLNDGIFGTTVQSDHEQGVSPAVWGRVPLASAAQDGV